MSELDGALEHVDDGRRAFIKKAVIGTALAVPVVSSFTMSGVQAVHADRRHQLEGERGQRVGVDQLDDHDHDREPEHHGADDDHHHHGEPEPAGAGAAGSARSLASRRREPTAPGNRA
ncbi:MAG: hypothetical protein U0W40_17005 [Acidimicrobiia bacterium]